MKNQTISFIIPAYNEEGRLQKTFQALLHWNNKKLELEDIIFVDDGSTDKTLHILKKQSYDLERALKAKVRIFSYKENMGKGYAVKVGMLASDSDYTLFFDADISTPLSELDKFIPFMNKGVDIIIGTRKNGHSTVIKHQPVYREILGKGFTIVSNTLLHLNITDLTCGFKAFSRRAKDSIFTRSVINRWAYDTEIMFIAMNTGYRIQEVPVIWSNDDNTKVRLFSDIFTSLRELLQIRFKHYNRSFPLIEKPIVSFHP